MSEGLDHAIQEHQQVVSALLRQVGTIERMAERLVECFRSGGRLYLCGNGGSAADAQHIAAELVGRFKLDHAPLPAVALTTDTSTLTAVANDFAFESVFSRQVEALVAKRDILWVLSVSGKSANVVAALTAARRIGTATFAFTGKSGGSIKNLCDLCLCADHESSDRVQEVHQLAYHLICERVERCFPKSREC